MKSSVVQDVEPSQIEGNPRKLHGQGYETMLTQGYELALNASSYLTR
jgi:hypothetical protein